MHNKKRKYLSEFAVNLFTARWLMVPASELMSQGTLETDAAETVANCHIYLICQRPAVSYEKESFSHQDGKLKGNIVYRLEGDLFKEAFEIDFPLLDDAIEVRLSPYPHREAWTFDKKNQVVRRLPAHTLSIAHDPSNTSHIFRHLKVLYVGQSFASGARNAWSRLQSHSTLQKILAQANYSAPDSEIMLMMFEYAPYRVITSMNGYDKDAIDDERNVARYISILENPLKVGEQVALAEAALIRYFQPKYNVIYKTRFPSPKLKVLSRCYDYDFSALIVEINTDDLNLSLFSDQIAPSTHHSANIDLVSHQQRKSFFHMLDGTSTAVYTDKVIE